MKTPRAKIKFLQLPHSVISYLRELSSKAASDLLVYLCQRTIGFGESAVTVSYQKIAEVLKISVRTVARVARTLEDKGYIIREAATYRRYSWKVVLQEDDVIFDPGKTLCTAQTTTPMSSPRRHECPDPEDTDVMTSTQKAERSGPREIKATTTKSEQNQGRLKKLSENTYTKTPADGGLAGGSLGLAPRSRSSGDGSLAEGKLYPCRGREVVGSEVGVKSKGQRAACRTAVCKTRLERERLETERLEREERYREESRSLGQRFLQLPEEVQGKLKGLAVKYLERVLPKTKHREEMLKDPALVRMANRTVLEQVLRTAR